MLLCSALSIGGNLVLAAWTDSNDGCGGDDDDGDDDAEDRADDESGALLARRALTHGLTLGWLPHGPNVCGGAAQRVWLAYYVAFSCGNAALVAVGALLLTACALRASLVLHGARDRRADVARPSRAASGRRAVVSPEKRRVSPSARACRSSLLGMTRDSSAARCSRSANARRAREIPGEIPEELVFDAVPL